MEDTNLFLLRIILVSILFTVVSTKDTRPNNFVSKSETLTVEKMNKVQDFYLKPELKTSKHVKDQKHKNKRDAYGNQAKYWGSKSSNFGYGGYSNNMPLYLVYNRKVGAYYPYFKYPKENSVRRNGDLRRVPKQ